MKRVSRTSVSSRMLYIWMLHYQGFTRVYHSTTAQPNSLASVRSFRVALDYLVSSDSPTYHDVSAHTCARFSLVRSPSSSYRLGCSSWGRIDPVGSGFTATEGFGLWLSRISLKDFRRSSWTARRRPLRRGNEEAAARGIRGRRSERRRSKDEESESSCLSEGKRYLLGRWWSGGERNGEEVAGNEDLAGRYAGESLEMSKDEEATELWRRT